MTQLLLGSKNSVIGKSNMILRQYRDLGLGTGKTSGFKKPDFSCKPTLSPAYKSSQAEPAPKPVQKTFLSFALPPLCLSISLIKSLWKFLWGFLSQFLSWGIQEPNAGNSPVIMKFSLIDIG